MKPRNIELKKRSKGYIHTEPKGRIRNGCELQRVKKTAPKITEEDRNGEKNNAAVCSVGK